MRQLINTTRNSPSNYLGDARLKVTATATGGTVLIPDPEVTTFRPCSMMDDFVIIGELVFVLVFVSFSCASIMFIVYLYLTQSSCFLHLFKPCPLFLSVKFIILSSYCYVFILRFLILHHLFSTFFLPPLFPPSTLFTTLSPSLLLPYLPHLPLSSTTATDGLWDVMTSQAAVDYVTDNLIRAGILPPRSEQSDDYTFQDRSTPTRGLVIFIIM